MIYTQEIYKIRILGSSGQKYLGKNEKKNFKQCKRQYCLVLIFTYPHFVNELFFLSEPTNGQV